MTAARRLTGLAALAALLVLLLGIPAALIAVAGNPVAAGLPSWSDLLSPDDGSLFLRLLVLVGWLAWASLAVSVAVEAASALRGHPAPRLPALHLQQHAAAGLIGAAALLFSISGPALASPAHASPAAASTVAAVASPARATPPAPKTAVPAAGVGAPGSAAAAPTAPPQATAAPTGAATRRTYLVQPGESLWSIAERELGDGARFAEIAELNYGRPQPDGQALNNTHWIHRGWTLTLPAAADGRAAPSQPASEHTRTVQRGDTLSGIARAELGDPARYRDLARASRDLTQPDGAHLTDPDVLEPGWTVRIPATPPSGSPAPGTSAPGSPKPGAASPPAPARPPVTPAPAPPTALPTAPPAAGRAAPTPGRPTPGATPERLGPPLPATPTPTPSQQAVPADDDQPLSVRTVAGVGALLAAGVIALVARRRHTQQSARPAHTDLPLPDDDSAVVEQDLRAAADPLSVETVDLALRTLAARCAHARQPLPVVRAARLTAGQFDLYLAEPAALPAPWTGTADATVWTLPADADGLLTADQAGDVSAPYPSLVTVGHDHEDGHVMLDLEHLGTLGVSGDATTTREVLAALAIELATSRWADDLQVTIVGAAPELEDTLRTGRIRYQPAVGHVLDQLARRADTDRAALQDAGAASLQHARATGAAPDTCTPEIVLLTGTVTDRQRQQVEELVDQLPRVAVAVVNSGQPVGEWALHLDDQHTAVLEPLGLQLTPQRVDDQAYARILDILSTADDVATPSQPAPPEPALDDVPPAAAAATATGAATATSDGTEPAGDPVDQTELPAPARRIEPAHDPRPVVLDLTDAARPTPQAVGSVRLNPAPGAPLHVRATPDVTDDAQARDARTAGTDPTSSTGSGTLAVPAAKPPAVPVVEPVVEPADSPTDGGATATAERVEPAAMPSSAPDDARTHETTLSGPRMLLLGKPQLTGTRGPVDDSRVARYTELAAILTLQPGIADTTVRGLYFAGRKNGGESIKAVTQAISRLRRWLGDDAYLPTNEARRRLGPDVTSDWGDFLALLPDGSRRASTDALEQALALVRGRPLRVITRGGSRTYPWAAQHEQRMISAIVDVAYELARRRLVEGRHQAVLDATARGLLAENGVQRLWRLRILAAHASGNTTLEGESIDSLIEVTDALGRDLEPATAALLEQLRNPTTARTEHLTAHAL